jgi:hypothetical protein
MLAPRLLWGGGAIISALTVYLAWAQVADHLARWSFGVIGGLLFIASMIMFPWGQNDDGLPRRLIKTNVRGRNNPTFVTGEGSTNTGNILNTGRGNVTVGVTATEARQISIDASHAEVLPAARAVASATAVAAIDERSGKLVDLVIARINETNPQLFVRWDDPRFLAALVSAQRSYAETGDDDLADILASMLEGLASQPIRSRREITLRQAIEVAPRLTTEHINALAVKMYLTYFNLTGPYENTEQLIGAFDTLLNHYYGGLPSSPIDYGYMSSTGVCYTDQLSTFASGPYQLLHNNYPNAMYPAFTFGEVREMLLSDDNENRQEYQQLLGVIAKSADDVVQTDQGTVFPNPDDLLFRVAPNHVATVLTSNRNVEQQLTEPQKHLRTMIQQRSLTVEEFQQKVKELKPELADFLDYIERTGAMSFHLHPVGFVLAQHEIKARAPQMAALIDAAFDDDAKPASE